MGYQVRRLGQVFAKKEASFGTEATFAATDAIRHMGVQLNRKRNAANSPERFAHPSLLSQWARRNSYDWSLSGLVYPSGTINTLPDMDELLICALGAQTNITLSTTVSASPTPTTTVFTVASVTGLVVGDAVLIGSTPAPAGKYVRWITAINGSALTVAPALPAAPASTDPVKGCPTYKLATAIGGTLTLGHYLTDISFEAKGAAVETLRLTFDANEELKFEMSGPAKNRVRPAQSKPGAFTTVGTFAPSGLLGSLRSDAVAQDFVKAVIEITNGIVYDNVQFGTSEARGLYRPKQRAVKFAVDSVLADSVVLPDAADAGTDACLLLQTGDTEGKIVAVYAPQVVFEVPDDADGDETVIQTFNGTCKSPAAGNGELSIAFA